MLPPPRSGCSDFPRGSGRRKLRGPARRWASGPRCLLSALRPGERRGRTARPGDPGAATGCAPRPPRASTRHRASAVPFRFLWAPVLTSAPRLAGGRERLRPQPPEGGASAPSPAPPLPGPRSRRPAPRGCAFTHPPPSSGQGEVAPKGSLPHPPPTGRGPGRELKRLSQSHCSLPQTPARDRLLTLLATATPQPLGT